MDAGDLHQALFMAYVACHPKLSRQKAQNNVNAEWKEAREKYQNVKSLEFCNFNNGRIQLYKATAPIKKVQTLQSFFSPAEKERIIKLSINDKRKIYGDFVSPESIEPWSQYSVQHAHMSSRVPTSDDEREFRGSSFDAQLNKMLAEKVAIFRGDITKLEVDAIVNAANSRLQGRGGVDGAIHRAAGRLLQDECNSIGGCPTGEAVITGGYNLPADYVIHTVGPQDQSSVKLTACYVNCFALVPQYRIRTIAFPCISTGIYGFPNRLAAHIALRKSREALEKDAKRDNIVEKVIFCTFMPVDQEIYETLMQLYFPVQ